MSNANGSYPTTPELTMRAFDKLPPTARRALAEAAVCWAVQPVLTWHKKGRKGYRTGPEIAAAVAGWDRNAHDKDAKRGLVAPLPRGALLKLGRQ